MEKLTIFQLTQIADAGFPIFSALSTIKDVPIEEVKGVAVLDGIEFDEFVAAMRLFFQMAHMVYKVETAATNIKFPSGGKLSARHKSGKIKEFTAGSDIEAGELVFLDKEGNISPVKQKEQ